jgi:hypothetical protein
MILLFDKISKIVPEEIRHLLEKCEQTPQSKTWHPEGDVLIHTKIVYERARKSGNLDYALAALFHDLGKTETTRLNKRGSWGSYGHEFVSARLVIKYQDWISRQGGDVDLIHDIVINHMKVKMMGEMRQSKQEEIKKKPNFNKIKEFSEFDNMRTLTPEELSF